MAHEDEPVWQHNAEIPAVIGLAVNAPDYRWDVERELTVRHVEWCLRREESGEILAAGPLRDSLGTERADAVIIVLAATVADAERIIAEDPLVRAGRRRYLLARWLINQGVVRRAIP
jgi:uncharacterized protein YciI